MCGYLQPALFVQKIYPTIYNYHGGFVDRLLLCIPMPHLLKENKVEQWSHKLQEYDLRSFGPVYMNIEKWHFRQQIYEMDEKAKAIYVEFSDEITKMMNSKWEATDDDHEQSEIIGNVSKDRRVMIRCSNNIYIT